MASILSRPQCVKFTWPASCKGKDYDDASQPHLTSKESSWNESIIMNKQHLFMQNILCALWFSSNTMFPQK